MMVYKESPGIGNGYRRTYIRGFDRLLEERRAECAASRNRFIAGVQENREAYRRRYLDMLGWPLNAPPQPLRNVIESRIFEDDSICISRMQFEVFAGFLFYGILFRIKSEQPLPLVIAQHGSGGTPELCSNFYGPSNYNDMTERMLRQGVHVFAPQLALWNEGEYQEPTRRPEWDACLRQVGGSMVALEIYCLQRCLDYFASCGFTTGRFGMIGLSAGGFYTLYTAAAEPRILAALTSCHFSDRTKYNRGETAFFNAAGTFLDAEVAALVCPRYLRIEVADNDQLFDAQSAEGEYQRLKKFYDEAPHRLEFQIFKGEHEFCPHGDDTGLQKVADLLKSGQA